MTPPTTDGWLLIFFSIAGWLAAWFGGRRNGREKTIRQNERLLNEHRSMYADYKLLHDIKTNGKEEA